MPDFKKMTVESLRDLARKVLGPGHSKKAKSELVSALEGAAARGSAAARGTGGRARAPGRGEAAVGKAARAARGVARKAGEAARGGAKAVARAGKAAAGAGKAAASAAKGAKAATGARARRPGKVAAAVAAVAGIAAGAAAGAAAARRAVKAAKAARAQHRQGEGPDPEGHFVARVRGEDAVREAPHPMAETSGDGWSEADEAVGAPAYEEQLGDLPWSYGDDAFVALPRDPRTLFLYWDWSQRTLATAFEGLDRPRTQLWIFARAGGDWERVRVTEFALESKGFYVHDLAPGRVYRAEIHALDRAGRERLLAVPSNECALPPVGPSPVVDDRFVRIPWEVALGKLGPGHAGGPFSDDARALLARLSDWSRFSGQSTWGWSAGGMGGRPSSPTSSPSSPFGGGGR